MKLYKNRKESKGILYTVKEENEKEIILISNEKSPTTSTVKKENFDKIYQEVKKENSPSERKRKENKERDDANVAKKETKAEKSLNRELRVNAVYDFIVSLNPVKTPSLYKNRVGVKQGGRKSLEVYVYEDRCRIYLHEDAFTSKVITGIKSLKCESENLTGRFEKAYTVPVRYEQSVLTKLIASSEVKEEANEAK